ncbi:hypothetical protein [Nostoc sp. 'Peltigera membranacea cyanobiont' 232]|uniref:hypothetical protein n=1 Tax=Nostoc sp. 'Peltigera membranacea cyanobiont' 232 TaxID=2014531 RepID=UPI001CB9C8E2|nr:hypothetical protein [Nostoc sp. 'Peltigera membranacea cyanobiont' 232]
MAQTVNHSPGSIVTCRSRQWVVLPSENQDVIRLRPLSGNEDEIAGIYQKLLQEKLENIQSATFPLPQATSVQDHAAALLLMDAARLLLRSGAGPFRCLGRLSCCVFNLYMRCGQDARTTIILRFRTIQFSCTSAYHCVPVPTS